MGLRLIANDTDDLVVLASAMQDAILRVGDIRYDAQGRSLSLRVTRFRHESQSGRAERIECGLRCDGVLSVRSRGLDRAIPDAFAVLLNITFEESDAPAGLLTLDFADDGVIEIGVEGLDVMLSDVGESRRTRVTPDHELS